LRAISLCDKEDIIEIGEKEFSLAVIDPSGLNATADCNHTKIDLK
jgi:hypothetical protein